VQATYIHLLPPDWEQRCEGLGRPETRSGGQLAAAMQAHSGAGDDPLAPQQQPQDDTQQIRQALVSSAQALYAHMVSHDAEKCR
jgi:hypothetical protein